MDSAALGGPIVICVRGPSRSGKSTLCGALVAQLRGEVNIAWAKRTHHPLDLPFKSSGRVWDESPAAMVVSAPDRLQLTLAPRTPTPEALLAALPGEVDLVLLETHEFEPFPAVVSVLLEPRPEEQVIARFALESAAAEAASLAGAIRRLLPADLDLWRALRKATSLHGHQCPGIVLGTRLALHGAATLGISIPDREKRLVVAVETDRCAADAIESLTGCRPGKRTLRLLDYGKLAATFFDQKSERAIRVAARAGLRDLAVPGPEETPTQAQRRTYLALPSERLFEVVEADFTLDPLDGPGRPRCRVACAACGEEVSDGRHARVGDLDYCRPCANVRD